MIEVYWVRFNVYILEILSPSPIGAHHNSLGQSVAASSFDKTNFFALRGIAWTARPLGH